MAVRTDLGPGTQLASYTVVSVLGRGAMSVVYAAEDARLGRRVALKVLAPSLAESERFRERFLHESRVAASIDHPNVIPIYEAGEADGLLFIAMRLVVGTDLRGLLARTGRLEPDRALRIVEQVASALDAAHAAGLHHRDVKPGNILLADDETANEHVYLSDFGLAVTGGTDGGLDEASFNGTAEYVAPEQIHGHPEARSDVYSLACVLYECLAGEPPFGRRRLLPTLWAHLHEEPLPLSERREDCPAELDSVFAIALAKAPEDRPATSGELVTKARAAFGLEPSVPSPWRRAAVAAALLASAVAATVGVALAVEARSATETPTVDAPIISTFAGTGRDGFAGDGGPAVRARLSRPLAVAVDRAGTVYVGEEGSRVRRIGRDGTIETVAGTGELGHSGDGGSATAAEIATPIGLAVGPDNALYILQHDRPAIRRVDGRGRISTVVGTGNGGFLDVGPRTVSPDLCGRPLGLAVGPDGALYVACPNSHRVIRVEPNGSFTTVAGTHERGYSGDGGPAIEARLVQPAGIAFDGKGNLYIADELDHRIRRVDPSGIITTFAGTGRPGISGDGFRAPFVELWSPAGVAVDAEDNVYILERGVSRVRKVDPRGFITTLAGTGKRGFSGDGGAADEAQLSSPEGVAVDRHGNVFIADRGNDRVRIVASVTDGE